MSVACFADLYGRLDIPVIVCRREIPHATAYLNPAAALLFAPGVAAPCAGIPLENLLRSRSGDSLAAILRALNESGAVAGAGLDVLSHRGGERALRVFATAADHGGGEYFIFYLLKRPAAAPEADDALDVFRTVADNLDELVYISDIDTYELKYVSKSLAQAMRKPMADILALPCWRSLHRGQTGPCPFCPIPKLKARPEGDDSGYIWELHNSMTGKWYMVKNTIISWTDGSRVHLGTLVDISYRRQYEEQLKRFAATDAMTDVFNRKWGFGKLDELFRADPETRKRQTLCFIDIDDLKRVNDSLGHAVGDEMIMNTINTVFSCIRKDDFIVRWGGDEFVVFLNCGYADAASVLKKILFGLEHFNSTREKAYRLSISYGLVDFSEEFETVEQLVDAADQRMYAYKLDKKSECGQ